MSDTIFGWELTYKTVESSLSKNTDVLVAFIHFFLLKNKLKIVGIGDEKSVNERDKERQSELLPEGWNQMENGVYKLRYLHDNKLYILHATEVDDLLITNLLDVETLKVSNVTFRIGDTVVLNAGSALTAVKNASEVYDKLNSELLQPVFAGAAKSTQTQTEKKEDRSLLLERRIPPNLSDPVIPDFDRRFPGVGRGDLDPFGRGPGSIFPGPGIGRGGGFPNPLGVPPGARFDPFGPPAPNRFEPNPDHFRPPGYGDDMFM